MVKALEIPAANLNMQSHALLAAATSIAMEAEDLIETIVMLRETDTPGDPLLHEAFDAVIGARALIRSVQRKLED